MVVTTETTEDVTRVKTRVKCKTKYTTFSAGRLSKAIKVHMAPISNSNKVFFFLHKKSSSNLFLGVANV